jgi:hypothetical protein
MDRKLTKDELTVQLQMLDPEEIREVVIDVLGPGTVAGQSFGDLNLQGGHKIRLEALVDIHPLHSRTEDCISAMMIIDDYVLLNQLLNKELKERNLTELVRFRLYNGRTGERMD